MKKAAPLIAIALFVAALLVMPLGLSSYSISFLVTVFMAVTLAVSWNMFSGMTGYVSLGQGIFFGIGAYTFAAVTSIYKLPPTVGFILSAVVPAVVALLLGFVLLTTRMRVAYFAVIMLGLNEIAKTIVANTKPFGSSYGLSMAPLVNTYFAYYFLCALAAAAIAFAAAVRHSRWGYGLRAILADEVAAEVTGINTAWHKLAMFVVSAVFIGLTGAVIGWNWSYVDPYMAFDLTVSFDMLVMAVFGGFGTIIGPVVGAVFMSVVSEFLATTLPDLHAILFGVLVIVLIIWCPGGLVEAIKWLGQKRHRRMAKPLEEAGR